MVLYHSAACVKLRARHLLVNLVTYSSIITEGLIFHVKATTVLFKTAEVYSETFTIYNMCSMYINTFGYFIIYTCVRCHIYTYVHTIQAIEDAKNCIMFLNTLKPWILRLHKAHDTDDIIRVFPPLLHVVQLIWRNCR